MTTAHRPTYVPAKGSATQGGNKTYVQSQQHSSKDLPSNLTLKTRVEGQGNHKDVKRIDFKRELLERENKAKQLEGGLYSSIYGDGTASEFNEDGESNISNLTLGLFSKDITSDLLGFGQPQKKQRLDSEDISEIKFERNINNIVDEDVGNIFPQDKDDEFEESKDEDNEDEDDDEDSEAELLREYEKIKRMREDERKEKEKLEAEKVKQETQESILMGNPLLNTSYSLKKKWYEDTIFKNQSKNEQKVKKRFINDTVRSDFHRKFIAKSIQ
jgi:protein CWC15